MNTLLILTLVLPAVSAGVAWTGLVPSGRAPTAPAPPCAGCASSEQAHAAAA